MPNRNNLTKILLIWFCLRPCIISKLCASTEFLLLSYHFKVSSSNPFFYGFLFYNGSEFILYITLYEMSKTAQVLFKCDKNFFIPNILALSVIKWQINVSGTNHRRVKALVVKKSLLLNHFSSNQNLGCYFFRSFLFVTCDTGFGSDA